mmetsp:Transcript_10710/g.24405  ORF Transcript_10710/g.24405 Transcript_10710/m.24405 type:complete len:506 (+) Transcript_10710:98-1615(+)
MQGWNGHVLCVLVLATFAQLACTESHCEESTDYPACNAPVATSQRVRREVRSLSQQQWDAVVDAMWIMKTTSMEEGRAQYGSAYRSYDYFTTMHAVISTDSRGDQSHFGSQFATVHAAICFEFENALLAVDPSIEGLPYWDNAAPEPSVFTDEYFGSDDPSWQIKTGRFANWTIMEGFNRSEWAEYIVHWSTVTFRGNSAGQLRGNTNELTTPVASRLGGEAAVLRLGLTEFMYWRCANGVVGEHWEDWQWCMDGPGPGRGLVHTLTHQALGGQNGAVIGDFADVATSPNDPVFMFFHANMVRSAMWWMVLHSEQECSYYGYPLEEGAFSWMDDKQPLAWHGTEVIPTRRGYYGTSLSEVPGNTWGWTNESLGISNSAAPLGQFTNADLICWLMKPDTAPYVFDTQAACLEDESACHPLQMRQPHGSDPAQRHPSDPKQPEVSQPFADEASSESGESSKALIAQIVGVTSWLLCIWAAQCFCEHRNNARISQARKNSGVAIAERV